MKRIGNGKLYLGIDPGLTGALAVLGEKEIIDVYDTPTLIVKKGSGKRTVYVVSAMADLVKRWANTGLVKGIVLETVHAMPGQGVTSMFSLGQGFGIWLGIIAAFRLPLTKVEPRVWKQAMGIPSGAEKSESVVRAAQLFPTASLARKKDHGRADALLLAEYLRRLLKNS